MRITAQAFGLDQLVGDLERSPENLVKKAREIVETTAIDVRDDWRKNALASSHAYSKHYQRAINYQMTGFTSIGADIEPREGMKQAAMSFEYGSRNQPPHLDGLRAMEANEPKFFRRLEQVEPL